MPIVMRTVGVLVVSLFVFVEIADARLLRSSGRGSLSRNFSQGFYFVENRFLNEVGILSEIFETDFSGNSIVRGVAGGGRGVGAVPNTCLFGYTQDDLDFVEDEKAFLQEQFDNGLISEDDFDREFDRLDASIDGEPCVWEFAQDEDLFTFGFFSLFFDTPDVMYDVNWRIAGNGESRTFEGGINDAGPIPAPDPAFQIDKGWVTLALPALRDLAPGDYTIDVSVALSSTTGSFFWDSNERSDPIEFLEICEFNPEYDAFFENPDNFDDDGNILPGLIVPDDEICGYNSVDSSDMVRGAPTFFQSEPEILRILPAVFDPDPEPEPSPTSSPTTLATLLIGWGVLLHRRRRQYRRRR